MRPLRAAGDTRPSSILKELDVRAGVRRSSVLLLLSLTVSLSNIVSMYSLSRRV